MATRKIVLNCDYGIFDLSPEAIELFARMKGLDLERRDHGMSVGALTRHVHYYHHGTPFRVERIARHDPTLVAVVEELGERANGRFANLYVKTIHSSRYRITDHGGAESVETPETIEWIDIADPERESASAAHGGDGGDDRCGGDA